MQLLKLDHGNVNKLERESAERDRRHSILMNSSSFKKGTASSKICETADNSELQYFRVS
jgi:hypothetical protein